MSCYRCICATCANNVERINSVPGEADFGCINCDTCAEYIGYYAGSHNKKAACEHYKQSVERIRASLTAIEGGKRRKHNELE